MKEVVSTSPRSASISTSLLWRIHLISSCDIYTSGGVASLELGSDPLRSARSLSKNNLMHTLQPDKRTQHI